MTRKELNECHDFEKYMDALLQRQSEIEREFPNIFYAIVITLRWLIHHEDLIDTFSYIDEQKVINYITAMKSIEIIESSEVYKLALVRTCN